MAADDWVGKRFKEPVERLTRSYFDPEHIGRGRCMYCLDDDDDPGPVFMWRDNDTLLLRPNHCNCVLCGQRYYVALEDLKECCGIDPSERNIYDFETVVREQAGWRSIDDEWHPGT